MKKEIEYKNIFNDPCKTVMSMENGFFSSETFLKGSRHGFQTYMNNSGTECIKLYMYGKLIATVDFDSIGDLDVDWFEIQLAESYITVPPEEQENLNKYLPDLEYVSKNHNIFIKNINGKMCALNKL